MTMFTKTPATSKDANASFSLHAFVAALFQLELREKLDRETAGDRADVPYTWGL